MSKGTGGAASFWKLFGAKTISVDLCAREKSAAIAELVDLLVAAGKIERKRRDAIVDALVSREQLGSTGIGAGVAIPHVKIDEVSESVAAIGVAKEAVDYDSVDGEPCDIFLMLLSPTAEAETHLEILRWLAKLVRNPDFCRFLRAAKTPKETLSLLKEMSGG